MSFIPRIFVNENLDINKEIKLTDKQHHYLYNVIKSSLGNNIILINGMDGEFLSKIIFLNNKHIILKIFEKIRNYVKQNFIGLIIPIIQKIDIVLKASTEIGVTDFFFIKTEYSKNNIFKDNKIEGNIIEAIEQSERLDFPNIHKISTIKNILDTLNSDENLIFFCEERTSNNSFKSVINNLDFKNKKIYCLVGAEAGFSNEEKRIINSYKNVVSISLGNNILRTETATISILSLIKNFLF